MNIIFTIDSMYSGGAERVVSSLSNEFTLLGHKVTIIMVSNDKNYSFYQLNSGIKLVALLKDIVKRPKFFSRVKLLKRAILNEKPDVVISFLPHVIIYTSYALSKLNIPFFVSERNDPNKYSYFYKALIKNAFQKADGCIFQTKDAMNWYGDRIKNKSKIIFNPINLTYYPSFITSDRNKIVFSVGRLVSQKNFKLLIDAFELFNKQLNGYSLRIYGDGPLKDELNAYIKNKNLTSKVLLMGNSKTWHKDEYMSSLFVLSSDYEGMPNALMEAMALKIPCISTNCPVGGPKELINNGVNGYLTSTNNASALAETMIKAINEPKIETTYKDKYSIETIAKQWLELIECLINKSR